MKNLVAKTLLLFISLCISLNVLTVEVIAANLSQYTSYPLSNTFIVQEDLQGSKEIVPYADIVGWRYKTVDGDLYRRLYNYSKEVWIGEWELY